MGAAPSSSIHALPPPVSCHSPALSALRALSELGVGGVDPLPGSEGPSLREPEQVGASGERGPRDAPGGSRWLRLESRPETCQGGNHSKSLKPSRRRPRPAEAGAANLKPCLSLSVSRLPKALVSLPIFLSTFSALKISSCFSLNPTSGLRKQFSPSTQPPAIRSIQIRKPKPNSLASVPPPPPQTPTSGAHGATGTVTRSPKAKHPREALS